MANNPFATIDMGTNSFKLLIVQVHSPGKFIPLLTLKEPIILSHDSSSSSSSSSTISAYSQNLWLKSIQNFNKLIQTHNVSPLHVHCVTTSAIREARNKAKFIDSVTQTTGLKVEILFDEEESRFSCLCSLQFLSVFNNLVLNIDIGGGSTEFVIGLRGKVEFCSSLKLGHVTLTQLNLGVENLRDYIRNIVKESGVIEKVKNFGFELALGSSRTIRAIEKAIFKGYESKRDWKFNNDELKSVFERLCEEGEDQFGVFKLKILI